VSRDFVRTILQRSGYQSMQYMFLGIVFVSITSLAFVLMVAFNRLIGG
jgi:hypothetical protein